MVNQIINRKIEVCAKCGSKNKFRKYGAKVNGISYAKCKHCGSSAAIREYLLESNKSI